MESGRDELYHLGKDLSEQNNLADKHPQKAKEMRTQLVKWLKQTKATFPTPDPLFDTKKRDARWEHMKTSFKEGMEQKAARYFDNNFVPNKTWWGSTKD